MKTRRIMKGIVVALSIIAVLTGCGGVNGGAGSGDQKVVNVFTARHYAVDEQLFEMFTEETGIKVNVVKGNAEELIEKLKREGSSTQADLFITVDGGVLGYAKDQGVLQPVTSDTIASNVPEAFRDKEQYWIGMATRARVIVYAKDRVQPEQLTTYEDLTADQWKGKLLVRSSSSLYNQSLLASFIELNGEESAMQWAEGIVKNLARDPEGGDRDQAKAVAAGIGDIAIMNTYYLGLMLTSNEPEEVKVAEGLGVIFPNQETSGTHLNISGIGVTKHSKNKDNAIRLIEFITSKEAQEVISSVNFEFPVNPEAKKAELLQTWGDFKNQELDFGTLGEHNKMAQEIFNKAGWK